MSFIDIKPNALASITKNFDRTEKSLQEDVKILKNWMKNQRHLPEMLDDKSIQNFLTLNKFSIERAKRSIDMYYTLRSKIPDLFENSNPQCTNMKQYDEIACTVLLPKMTKEMYRVLFYKMHDETKIDELDPHNVMKQIINLQEIRLKEDVMIGDIFVFDVGGHTFGYMAKFTPPLVAKIFAVYEKIYSIPLKGLCFINSPSYINTILALVKKILKPKLAERVFACPGTSILSQILPKECTPKNFGGEAETLEELREILKIKMGQYQNRFDLLDKLRVNEDLRAEELRNDEVLGFHGNFKKLSVD